MIHFECRECGKAFRVKDEFAGKKTKCPQCGVSLSVPAPRDPLPLRQVASSQQTPEIPEAPPFHALAKTKREAEIVSPGVPPPIREYKQCDFCSEQILATAKKCKHCGETLDVVMRANAESRSDRVVTNVTVQQNNRPIVYGAPKSVALAIILAFFFGPLGMLYSTVAGSITLFFVNLILILPTAGLIMLITWPAGMAWAAIAASNHNQLRH